MLAASGPGLTPRPGSRPAETLGERLLDLVRHAEDAGAARAQGDEDQAIQHERLAVLVIGDILIEHGGPRS